MSQPDGNNDQEDSSWRAKAIVGKRRNLLNRKSCPSFNCRSSTADHDALQASQHSDRSSQSPATSVAAKEKSSIGLSRVSLPSIPVLPTRQHAGKADVDLPPPPVAAMRPRHKLVHDEFKEHGRQARRVAFDFEYWANHRSTWRYWYNIRSMVWSRTIRALLVPLTWLIFVATAICVIHHLEEEDFLGDFEFGGGDMAPLTLTSFALSLLLVFRTNSSYGRFDEARKMWGLMLNRSRDIVRMALAYFPELDPKGCDNQRKKAALARWVGVFTIALKCHLRAREDLEGEAEKLLTEQELQLLLNAEHKVLLCLQMMSHIIENAGVTGFQMQQMQANITTFEDILGGCERLLSTPIPVSYTRHTGRFLLIWLTVLPYPLWPLLKWGTIPAIAFIGLLLLGIEEIGVEIEEPFGILPLELISKKAQANIRELLMREDAVKSCVESVDMLESDNMFFVKDSTSLDSSRTSRDSSNRVEVDPATGKSQTVCIDKMCTGHDN